MNANYLRFYRYFELKFKKINISSDFFDSTTIWTVFNTKSLNWMHFLKVHFWSNHFSFIPLQNLLQCESQAVSPQCRSFFIILQENNLLNASTSITFILKRFFYATKKNLVKMLRSLLILKLTIKYVARFVRMLCLGLFCCKDLFNLLSALNSFPTA